MIYPVFRETKRTGYRAECDLIELLSLASQQEILSAHKTLLVFNVALTIVLIDIYAHLELVKSAN